MVPHELWVNTCSSICSSSRHVRPPLTQMELRARTRPLLPRPGVGHGPGIGDPLLYCISISNHVRMESQHKEDEMCSVVTFRITRFVNNTVLGCMKPCYMDLVKNLVAPLIVVANCINLCGSESFSSGKVDNDLQMMQ